MGSQGNRGQSYFMGTLIVFHTFSQVDQVFASDNYLITITDELMVNRTFPRRSGVKRKFFQNSLF